MKSAKEWVEEIGRNIYKDEQGRIFPMVGLDIAEISKIQADAIASDRAEREKKLREVIARLRSELLYRTPRSSKNRWCKDMANELEQILK